MKQWITLILILSFALTGWCSDSSDHKIPYTYSFFDPQKPSIVSSPTIYPTQPSTYYMMWSPWNAGLIYYPIPHCTYSYPSPLIGGLQIKIRL